MKIKIDWSDGRYGLYAPNGIEVEIPRWGVWLHLACGRVETWLVRKYLTPTDNKAWDTRERSDR